MVIHGQVTCTDVVKSFSTPPSFTFSNEVAECLHELARLQLTPCRRILHAPTPTNLCSNHSGAQRWALPRLRTPSPVSLQANYAPPFTGPRSSSKIQLPFTPSPMLSRRIYFSIAGPGLSRSHRFLTIKTSPPTDQPGRKQGNQTPPTAAAGRHPPFRRQHGGNLSRGSRAYRRLLYERHCWTLRHNPNNGGKRDRPQEPSSLPTLIVGRRFGG